MGRLNTCESRRGSGLSLGLEWGGTGGLWTAPLQVALRPASSGCARTHAHTCACTRLCVRPRHCWGRGIWTCPWLRGLPVTFCVFILLSPFCLYCKMAQTEKSDVSEWGEVGGLSFRRRASQGLPLPEPAGRLRPRRKWAGTRPATPVSGAREAPGADSVQTQPAQEGSRVVAETTQSLLIIPALPGSPAQPGCGPHPAGR